MNRRHLLKLLAAAPLVASINVDGRRWRRPFFVPTEASRPMRMPAFCGPFIGAVGDVGFWLQGQVPEGRVAFRVVPVEGLNFRKQRGVLVGVEPGSPWDVSVGQVVAGDLPLLQR